MIPTGFRAEEFALHVSWTPRVNGVTPATPGFYVRASFANEGTATGVVKGSWNGGSAGPGSLAEYGFMHDLFVLLSDYAMLEDVFDLGLGSILDRRAQSAQTAALEAKRARLEKLRTEVLALEAELGA